MTYMTAPKQYDMSYVYIMNVMSHYTSLFFFFGWLKRINFEIIFAFLLFQAKFPEEVSADFWFHTGQEQRSPG